MSKLRKMRLNKSRRVSARQPVGVSESCGRFGTTDARAKSERLTRGLMNLRRPWGAGAGARKTVLLPVPANDRRGLILAQAATLFQRHARHHLRGRGRAE